MTLVLVHGVPEAAGVPLGIGPSAVLDICVAAVASDPFGIRHSDHDRASHNAQAKLVDCVPDVP